MAGPLTALDGFILTVTSCFASHGLRNLLLEACFDISYPTDMKSVQSIGDLSYPQAASKQREDNKESELNQQKMYMQATACNDHTTKLLMS